MESVFDSRGGIFRSPGIVKWNVCFTICALPFGGARIHHRMDFDIRNCIRGT